MPPPGGSAFSGVRRSAEQALDASDSRDPTTIDNVSAGASPLRWFVGRRTWSYWIRDVGSRARSRRAIRLRTSAPDSVIGVVLQDPGAELVSSIPTDGDAVLPLSRT